MNPHSTLTPWLEARIRAASISKFSATLEDDAWMARMRACPAFKHQPLTRQQIDDVTKAEGGAV